MVNDYFEPNSPSDIEHSPPPFAGRQSDFARIQQYLVDPSDRHALLYIGRRSIGKSAMLLQCLQVFGDNVIGCYFSLKGQDFTSELEWLNYLVQQTQHALEAHHLNTSRLNQTPDENQNYRDWLSHEYLVELGKLIRPHRRLVWLFDDVEHLIHAIRQNVLPTDTFAFLFQLLQAHLQLGVVMTLHENNESQVIHLSPLIDINRIQRLHPLDEDETAELMLQFAPNIAGSASTHIYNLTDGHPMLLEVLGNTIASIQKNQIVKSDIDSIINIVYARAHETYRSAWKQSLSQNERLVLTAISGLLYEDPLGDLTTQRIENWLLETDFPRDLTSINAGIRGLEYRDLIVGSTSEGVRIRSGLFQRWLIEHARMEQADTMSIRPDTNSDTSIQISRAGIILLLVAVVIAVWVVSSAQQSNTPSTIPAQPTVTLGTE